MTKAQTEQIVYEELGSASDMNLFFSQSRRRKPDLNEAFDRYKKLASREDHIVEVDLHSASGPIDVKLGSGSHLLDSGNRIALAVREGDSLSKKDIQTLVKATKERWRGVQLDGEEDFTESAWAAYNLDEQRVVGYTPNKRTREAVNKTLQKRKAPERPMPAEKTDLMAADYSIEEKAPAFGGHVVGHKDRD